MYEGQWQNGKRHGLGTEYRGRWTYRGEWTQGFKGRYGVRQATASNAKYEGTWANGLQDGYGSETYADGGTYQGQWLRGLRHGYGVRTSAPFGMASHFRPKAPTGSMTSLKSENAEPTSERDRRMDDVRGGFVLKAKSDEPPARRRSLSERSSNFKDSLLKGLKLRKQRSTGDLDKRGTNSSIRSTGSTTSWMSSDSAQSAVTSGSHHTDSNASFVVEDEQMDANVTETYMGEWKNDKRSGFGISERSDGLKYEGEWYNNKKYGYGVTTFRDGSTEEGKYKNNVLITSQKKKHLFLIRSAKFRERIDAAVNAAQRASKIALQKADIAISRTATARGKAEQADIAAAHAREDSEIARVIAKELAPDFLQPGKCIWAEGIRPRPPPPSLPPDLSKFTTQTPMSTSQMSARPGLNTGGREPVEPPRLEEPSSYTNVSSLSSYAPLRPQLPDRLDRTISTPLDTPQFTVTAAQQAPYMNRVNEPSGLYGPPPPPRLGPQHQQQQQQQPHPMDISGGESSKLGMNQSSSIRNSFAPMDSAPHSGPMDTGAMSAVGMGQDRGRDPFRRSQMNPAQAQQQQQQQRQMNPASNNNSNSAYAFQQAMSDHFDHYKRPPSRGSSMDRYGRDRSRGRTPEAGQQNPHSRAQSRQRTPQLLDNPMGARGASNPALDAFLQMETTQPAPRRGETPSRFGVAPDFGVNESVSVSGGGATSLEDATLRHRAGFAQDIPTVPYSTPKRTESLFLKPQAAVPKPTPMPKQISGGGGGGGAALPQRKKSLPDAVSLPRAIPGIPREELAALGSARRQELHRMQEEADRYKANPLLYLLNPNVTNWLSRQKVMVLVVLINLSLAILFLQLLT
ncbi:Junctophilin-3 [Orchesella cincta]|uniref:Junctophilin-3 n=1 Tax=Orchesella cincta TaxID=48709 RepID=A0A1D2NF19_ORCCI|nr:Junctophilin-3 [Orchesella cincta]